MKHAVFTLGMVSALLGLLVPCQKFASELGMGVGTYIIGVLAVAAAAAWSFFAFEKNWPDID